MNDYQFYPTPKSLAVKAWSLFKNREFTRILEPSAGKGDLALAMPWYRYSNKDVRPIDCCEIDIEKHPVLREAGMHVVGHDFMQLQSGSHYSHIIMNPPFAYGVQHLIKAWDLMWDGEIVAILNAESIKNPFSKERQLVVSLIEKHGSVEFVEQAFTTEDTLRRTEVEIALIYLRKQSNSEKLFSFDDERFSKDETCIDNLGADIEQVNDLIIPKSFIEMTVDAFNLATRAALEAVKAEAKANRYSAMVGKSMSEVSGEGIKPSPIDWSVSYVRNAFYERYLALKDRAWTSILRSADVTSRTSTNVQKQIESEFEQIKQLEFTYDNVHAFIAGLIQSSSKINLDMAIDCFDKITKYHSDNTVFYKGWKSNDKHRTCGFRIKTTRFILPGHGLEGWRTSISWETERLLLDFDKTFTMLDGKYFNPNDRENTFHGLHHAFTCQFKELCAGERVTTEYFDVRYYPGAGTIHFFPRSKSLIDRLNRLVGRHRQWLPPEGEKVSDEFWLQYDMAEKFDAKVRKSVKPDRSFGFRTALDVIVYDSSDDQYMKAQENLEEAIIEVLKESKIDLNNLIDFKGKPEVDSTSSELQQLDLLAA